MSTTCEEHHILSHRFKAGDSFWTTPGGITRRIDSIAQNFTYRVVNNAVKIIGETHGVAWLVWVTMGDDAVCPICVENSMKGDNGRFKPTWFTPDMPAHPGCRCQWMLIWE